MQNYAGIYNDIYDKYRTSVNKDNIDDDIVFEMELVKQIEVNIDYILMLVEKYHKSNCEDKTIIASIDKGIKSSLELRSKKELVDAFIATISVKTNVGKDWIAFVKEQQKTDLETLISDERLNTEETKKYLSYAFRDGQIKTSGTDIDKIMPPVSRFGGGSRMQKKQKLIDKLKAFFEKYYGLGKFVFSE